MLQYLYWFYRLFSYLMSKLQNQMWVYNNEKKPLQWISVLKNGDIYRDDWLKKFNLYCHLWIFKEHCDVIVVGFRFGI